MVAFVDADRDDSGLGSHAESSDETVLFLFPFHFISFGAALECETPPLQSQGQRSFYTVPISPRTTPAPPTSADRTGQPFLVCPM